MINALIALKNSDIQGIVENFDNLSDDLKEALQNIKLQAGYKTKTLGVINYDVMCALVPDEEKYQRITGAFVGSILLGVWDWQGELLQPIHPWLLEMTPDDVTYDEDGNEISRTPAVDYKQVHKWLGQKDRVFE